MTIFYKYAGLITFRCCAGSPAYWRDCKKNKSSLPRDLTYSCLDLTEAQLSLNHMTGLLANQKYCGGRPWPNRLIQRTVTPHAVESGFSILATRTVVAGWTANSWSQGETLKMSTTSSPTPDTCRSPPPAAGGASPSPSLEGSKGDVLRKHCQSCGGG